MDTGNFEDWTTDIDFDAGVIYWYSPNKVFCFIQRKDGVFLVYKFDGESYIYQEKKLDTLEMCLFYAIAA